MKSIFLIVSFIFSTTLYAQNDSVHFFVNQLRRTDLSEASIGYYNSRIGDYYSESSPAQALQYFAKAYIAGNVSGSNNIIYESCFGIANIFFRQSGYDSSLFYAKICHSVAEKIGSPLPLYNSLMLTGTIYMEKLQSADAKTVYDIAMHLSVANPGMPHRALIYMEMGNYYYKLFNFTKAIEVLKEGELIAQKSKEIDDNMRIFTALGMIYVYTSKADSVQYYLFAALDYFHRTGNLKGEAITNQKLGIAFGIFNNITKMEEYLDIAYMQLMKTNNIRGAINTLMLKANTYFKVYQFDRCLQALNIVEPVAINYNAEPAIAICYTYKAGIFTLAGDTSNAKKYQSAAEQINRKIKDPTFNQIGALAKAIVFSARLKVNMGDSITRAAIASAKKMIPETLLKSSIQTISLNKQLTDSNKDDLRNVYTSMLQKGNSNYHYSYESLIGEPIGSAISSVSNKTLLEMETRYKTKEKEDSLYAQTLLLALKNKSINTRNWFLIGLIVVAALIFLLFLRSATQSKKISRQFAEIQQLQTELKHRTGNFFNSISGMMSIALASTNDKPTLLSLQKRVSTVNHLYNTLYSSPNDSHLPFYGLLASLCDDFQHSFGSVKQLGIYYQCDAEISKEETIPLSFIITELMTNAVKYAFEETVMPEIYVEVFEKENKRVLHVWDNGKGKDESLTPRQGSQGMSIVKSYSKNLQGKFTTWNDSGFHFKMEF